MKEKLIPPLVLTTICIVVSALLVFVYNLTYVDTTGVLTDSLKEGCENIFGESEYKIITNTSEDGTVSPLQYGNIVNVIIDKANGNVLLEVVADGYAKDGIDVLVGFNQEGKVEGISIIALAETPGLGTKVKEKSFLDKFKDADANTDVQAIDSISGATYSSKGMKNAVDAAIKAYNENKEEIFSE